MARPKPIDGGAHELIDGLADGAKEFHALSSCALAHEPTPQRGIRQIAIAVIT